MDMPYVPMEDASVCWGFEGGLLGWVSGIICFSLLTQLIFETSSLISAGCIAPLHTYIAICDHGRRVPLLGARRRASHVSIRPYMFSLLTQLIFEKSSLSAAGC